MVSQAKQRHRSAGQSFIPGARASNLHYMFAASHAVHTDQEVPDVHVSVQPWPASATDQRRDRVIYYKYSHDRARRTPCGIAQQTRKPEAAVAGKTP